MRQHRAVYRLELVVCLTIVHPHSNHGARSPHNPPPFVAHQFAEELSGAVASRSGHGASVGIDRAGGPNGPEETEAENPSLTRLKAVMMEAVNSQLAQIAPPVQHGGAAPARIPSVAAAAAAAAKEEEEEEEEEDEEEDGEGGGVEEGEDTRKGHGLTLGAVKRIHCGDAIPSDTPLRFQILGSPHINRKKQRTKGQKGETLVEKSRMSVVLSDGTNLVSATFAGILSLTLRKRIGKGDLCVMSIITLTNYAVHRQVRDGEVSFYIHVEGFERFGDPGKVLGMPYYINVEADGPPAYPHWYKPCKEEPRGGSGGAGEKEVATQQCGLPGCKRDAGKRCTRCRAMWYCSQDHQRCHREAHQIQCHGSKGAGSSNSPSSSSSSSSSSFASPRNAIGKVGSAQSCDSDSDGGDGGRGGETKASGPRRMMVGGGGGGGGGGDGGSEGEDTDEESDREGGPPSLPRVAAGGSKGDDRNDGDASDDDSQQAGDSGGEYEDWMGGEDEEEEEEGEEDDEGGGGGLGHAAMMFAGMSDENYEPVMTFECDGDHCGVEVTGHLWNGCVLDQMNHPLPVFSEVIGVAENYVEPCWLEDGADVDDMEERYKRFILYYYMATQVFEWYDRTVMPLCCRVAIRSAHPNRRGYPYSDPDTDPPAAGAAAAAGGDDDDSGDNS